MTITISWQAYWELFQETIERSQHPNPDDAMDVVYKYPQALGQGYLRQIELREGLVLSILNLQLSDRLIIQAPQREHGFEWNFNFTGQSQNKLAAISDGQYIFYGSGLAPKETINCSIQPALGVGFEIEPELSNQLLRSFVGDPDRELPPELKSLIRQPDQEYCCRSGTATQAMQTVARQILQCPYQGIAKRMYLEGKVLELMGILVAQEVEIQNGNSKPLPLKPDVVDRVYHAREILLQKLDNPPSLIELARQVGLNDYLLKQGFRACFGTTAFSYLHHYRLEQAHQLLKTKNMKVSEVAKAVGFVNQSYFAAAFRKKFGLPPKEYQIQQKKSV
ncbi:MAG: AraC family transcriptional regulator [Nostoc sp.]|uniref:helix-turn-helix transcriptional regulator n=1 Tax=Nostoc sp. TaxID=1180 RepID=UPI002FFB4AEF